MSTVLSRGALDLGLVDAVTSSIENLLEEKMRRLMKQPLNLYKNDDMVTSRE